MPGPGHRFRHVLLPAAALAGAAPLTAAPAEGDPWRVLVFSRTEGFRHGAQIVAGLAAIEALGAEHGFLVDATEDDQAFAAENLAPYAAVIFLHTTGDVLDPPQEAAFEAYIADGGGWAGVHSAADTEYGWPFYGALVGAYFESHPPVQVATVLVIDPDHPSTAHLPAVFEHQDEWYDFQSNPADDPDIQVLLAVDERSYEGGAMGCPHPIAWAHEHGGGRAWYTAMGHTVFTYDEPFFRQHLLGGIQFAAGLGAPGDVNGDGRVDVEDLVAVIIGWGPCPAPPDPCAADANGDGAVDVDDLVVVIVGWDP